MVKSLDVRDFLDCSRDEIFSEKAIVCKFYAWRMLGIFLCEKFEEKMGSTLDFLEQEWYNGGMGEVLLTKS